MKKKSGQIIRGIIVAMGIVFLASLAAEAGPPQPGPVVKTLKPDLTVKLWLKVKKYTNDKGVTCYSTTPVYTVTNRGQAPAKNFGIKEAWMLQVQHPGRPWQTCGFYDRRSLGPGKSLTMDLGPVAQVCWCADKTGKIGFRVIADYKNNVAESNEHNNIATVYFPGGTAHPGALKHKVSGTPAAGHVKPK